MPAPLTTTLLAVAAIVTTLSGGIAVTIAIVAFLFEAFLFVASGSENGLG